MNISDIQLTYVGLTLNWTHLYLNSPPSEIMFRFRTLSLWKLPQLIPQSRTIRQTNLVKIDRELTD